ncbi:MAG: PTS sugar transporter subunit IIA [Fusobacteriaceae bacterium]
MKAIMDKIMNKKKIEEEQYSNDNLIFYVEEKLTKDELLKKMVLRIKENSDALEEKNDFYDNVLEREKIGSTGIGMGIAMPHARCNGAKKIVVSIALLKNKINFNSLDGENVELVIMIGAPKEKGKEYLNLVATLARAFRNKEYRENVISSKDSETLIKMLKDFK